MERAVRRTSCSVLQPSTRADSGGKPQILSPLSKIPHMISAHKSQWIGPLDSQEDADTLVSPLHNSQPSCVIPHLFYTYRCHSFLRQLASKMS